MLTQSQEQYRKVLQVAENLFRQDPDWVTFFREVLGIDGAVRTAFPSFDDLVAFEKSEEFEKLQKMLLKLREKRTSTDLEVEPTRVITVRLPKSMHEYLRTEAHDLRTSMNKLCISKLLQVIEEDKIPNERTASKTAARKAAAKTVSNLRPAPLAAPIATPIPTPVGTLAQPVLQTTTTNHLPPAPSPFKPTQPRF